MSSFDDRQKAQEAKFAQDASLRFKAEAKRNKMLGLWVAEKIGHADPDSYVTEVIAADFEEAGDDDVLRKVKADLEAANVSIGDDELRAKMAEYMLQASEELSA